MVMMRLLLMLLMGLVPCAIGSASAPVDFFVLSKSPAMKENLFEKVDTWIQKVFANADGIIAAHPDLDVYYSALKHKSLLIAGASSNPIKIGTLLDEALEQSMLLEHAVPEGLLPLDDLRCAVILRTTATMLASVQARLIRLLTALEQCNEYWTKQARNPLSYYLTQNPLALLAGNKKRKELDLKVAQIAQLRTYYEKILGTLVIRASSFDATESSEQQLLWIGHMIAQYNNLIVPSLALHKGKMAECFAYSLKSVIKQLAYPENRYMRVLDPVAIHSHVRRNWLWYGAGAAAVVVISHYMRKNKDMLSNFLGDVKQIAVRNYTNYVAEPLNDIKKDLFTVEGAPLSAGQKFIALSNEIKPTDESNQKLSSDIFDMYSRNNKKFEFGYSERTLAINATTLNQDFFDDYITQCARKWEEGGFIFESYLNPIAQTTKSKIINASPELGVFLYRIHRNRTEKKIAAGMATAAGRIHETEKKMNLILAGIALYPAYWIMQKGWYSIKKFGGYFIPKGYDDTPIKQIILLMHDELDDCTYLKSATDDLFQADPVLVGRLGYYIAKLRQELSKVNKAARVHMLMLLEKFSLAPTNKGKLVYLQKMVQEYDSWPRFINNHISVR